MAVVATIAKGYDLDYMWVNAAASAGDYYISAAEAGEPRGRWWGPGARALGLAPGREVERGSYDLLFGQRKDPDGTQLGRALRKEAAAERYQHVRDAMLAAEPHATSERRAELRIEALKQARISPLYLDLTISFSKSISVFHASLTENARLARLAGEREAEQQWAGLAAEMEDMIWQAVHAGFEYFQREAGYTRTGSHHQRTDGRETGQWREAELVVAHWLQHTSRDGDMQLHVHSQIAHICRTVVDGKWRAPDSLGYHDHVAATGSLVAQHLEEAMTRRFGVRWAPRTDGRGFEIAGIDADLMAVFSSRRASIDAATQNLAAQFDARYGRAPSQRELGELREVANLRTRKGKEHGVIDWDELPKGWAARLAATLGVSLASVAPSVSSLGKTARASTRADGPTPDQARRAAQVALALAQAEGSTFTRADLVKHLGRVLPRTGMDPAAAVRLVEQLADRALACEFSDVACLEAPEPVAVPRDLIRADGRSVFQRHGGTRYATLAQLSMEQRMLAQAQGPGAPCLTPEQSTRLLGADAMQLAATFYADAGVSDDNRTPGGLRLDQAAAAHAALTSDARVTVIDAPAGSGKTRVLSAIGVAWAASNSGRVIGVTPSQASRNTLAAAVAECYNTAQFLGHLPGQRGGRGRIPLNSGDLLLADEASMIGLPDLADIVGYVTEQGAKLVLAGDREQLQPVGNGGGMSLLAVRLGTLQLSTPVRFTAAWERQASLRFRVGDISALAEYDAHGRILGGSPEDMLEHAAQHYVALTLSGTDVLLMAQDHANRRELCRRIRGELIYLGRVAAGPSVSITDGQQASPGDLIVCTRNDHTLQAGETARTLANGDLLRIEQVCRDCLVVRRALDADPRTGQRRWSTPFTYRDYASAELGYAVTDHAAQSRTVHTGLQLITGTETRQQAYVGISRGTHANTALVCTTTPISAQPRPGLRAAPELARATRLAAERAGDAALRPAYCRQEAMAVLAGVLSRDGAQLSALQTQEQTFATAGNLTVLHAQWQAVTSSARAQHWRQVAMRALPESHRGELGPQARWLWRTLRTAELAGLDPAQILTTAISQRELTGARDIASVIDARIRRRIAGMVPLPQPGWCERIPSAVLPGHRQYVADLAAAMDQRTQRIGEYAAEHQPPWAVSALGPAPADPLDRLAWQRKASAIGGYRELAGFSDPAKPIGPEPVRGDADLRAAWYDAFACLGPVGGPDVRVLSDGTLRLLCDRYRAETQWAPRYLTDALRHIRIGAVDAEMQAIRRDALARASRDGGQLDTAASHEKLAHSYRAMATMYRSHEVTLAAVARDRQEWDAVTDQPRRLAVAADAQLRRRYPNQKLQPLRSAEPEQLGEAEVARLSLTPGADTYTTGEWIDGLTRQHDAFASKLAAARKRSARFTVPRHDEVYSANPLSAGAWSEAILKAPKPDIRPFHSVVEHAPAERDREAAD
ncbi:MAG: MobF family relaxase [Streptosporangiaceae bacterium]